MQRSVTDFLAKSLNQMGLVTEEKMAEILLGENGLDKDALKQFIEARRAAKLDERSAPTQKMEQEGDHEDDEVVDAEAASSLQKAKSKAVEDGGHSDAEKETNLRENDPSGASTEKRTSSREPADTVSGTKKTESSLSDVDHGTDVAGLSVLDKMQKKRETEDDTKLRNLRTDMEQRVGFIIQMVVVDPFSHSLNSHFLSLSAWCSS
jgi:hypothetical protein